MRCAVFGCDNSNQGKSKTNISMYHFPKNLKTQKKWLVLIGRKDKVNTKNARVCAAHFTSDDFQRDELMASLNLGEVILNKLKINAVPTQKMPKTKKEMAVGLARESRALKRKMKAPSNCVTTDTVEPKICQNTAVNRFVPDLLSDRVQPVQSQEIAQTAVIDSIQPARTTEYLDCIWCGGEIPHTCGGESDKILKRKLRYVILCLLLHFALT